MTNRATPSSIDIERLRRIVEISETEHAGLLRADQKFKDVRDQLADAERRRAYQAEWGGRSITSDSRDEAERRGAMEDSATVARLERAAAEVTGLRDALDRARASREAAGERHREAARLAGACIEFARRAGCLPPDLSQNFGRAAVNEG